MAKIKNNQTRFQGNEVGIEPSRKQFDWIKSPRTAPYC